MSKVIFPTMSVCVNTSDYKNKLIEAQKKRIEELEDNELILVNEFVEFCISQDSSLEAYLYRCFRLYLKNKLKNNS